MSAYRFTFILDAESREEAVEVFRFLDDAIPDSMGAVGVFTPLPAHCHCDEEDGAHEH